MNRDFLYQLLASCILFAVSGCAANLPYAPRDATWRRHLGLGHAAGYEDTRLGDSTYRVKIGPARRDDWRDLEKFALYRAAEVAKDRGYPFFVVVNAERDVDRNTHALPLRTDTAVTETDDGLVSTTTITGGDERVVETASYLMEYRVTDDPIVEEGRVHAVDAVISDLRYFIDSRTPEE